jgi:hypothetical protein
MIDNTIHPLITFTGSGVAGFFMEMFLRRVLKFLVIIIGSFLGAVFLVIRWMQARHYINPDNLCGSIQCIHGNVSDHYTRKRNETARLKSTSEKSRPLIADISSDPTSTFH